MFFDYNNEFNKMVEPLKNPFTALAEAIWMAREAFTSAGFPEEVADDYCQTLLEAYMALELRQM